MELEDKLNSVLNDPEMMQKIAAIANSLNQQNDAPPPKDKPQQPLPNFDPAMLQRMTGMMNGMGVDKNQRALLSALAPYLSRDRLQKLENAMRAAKMAGLAASAVQRRPSHSSSGR